MRQITLDRCPNTQMDVGYLVSLRKYDNKLSFSCILYTVVRRILKFHHISKFQLQEIQSLTALSRTVIQRSCVVAGDA